MSLSERKTDYDKLTIVRRGIDSETAASEVGMDQVCFAVNTTFRGQFPRNRPGMEKLELSGDSFQLGRWQGAHGYIAENGQPSIVASIGGQIVRLDPIGLSVTNLSTGVGLTNPSNLSHAWMVQAEKYLPIQDGSSLPLVWDGALLRRANPVASGGSEFPVGCMMEVNNGRLWVVLPGRRTFWAGDLAYSVTGTAADMLGGTENQFLNGGGEFVMPTTAGFITAMKTVAVQDTVVGQGPLQVFGETGTASMNVPFDRETWQFLRSPIETQSLLSSGPRSNAGVAVVNGDLWYRAGDGVRSFMMARRDHGSWVNTPLSSEMTRVLGRDDGHLLPFGSAAMFDNRLLVTVSPYRATYDSVAYGVAHRGLAALDFDPVSGMFNREQPAWEGIWTGLKILHILTLKCYGVDRCFIFALNGCHQIELWELSKDKVFDNLDDRIEWVVETRGMGFSDKGEILKQLARAERWFDRVSGVVDYDIKFRPDQFWGWLDLDSGSVCATTDLCSPPGCLPSSPQLQYRPRKLSAAPDDACDAAANRPYRNAFEFQFKLTVDGSARLRRFRAVATEVAEDTAGGCLGDEDCQQARGCEYDPWRYAIENTCQDADAPDDGPAFPPEREGGCVAPPNIASFTATPTETAAPGDPATLAWGEVTNANAASIDNGIGTITTPDSVVVNPAVTTTYTLTARCGASIMTRTVTVYVAETPPEEPDIEYNGDDPPTMPCEAIYGWTWLDAGLEVRYPSSGNHDQNPNALFEAALISWWVEQTRAAFIAYGAAYTGDLKFYWLWSESLDSWNAVALNDPGVHLHYINHGWTIGVAYCEA